MRQAICSLAVLVAVLTALAGAEHGDKPSDELRRKYTVQIPKAVNATVAESLLQLRGAEREVATEAKHSDEAWEAADFFQQLKEVHVVVAATCLLVAAVAWAGPRKCTPTSTWTGCRAALALLILCEHTGHQPLAFGGSFFLLSGCILAHVSAKASPLGEYAQFQGRRLIRIFPAYWALMCVRTYQRSELRSSPAAFIGGFLALESWGTHTHDYLWFVSDIVVAYLAMPFLEWAFVKLGTRTRLGVTISVAACCYVLQLAAGVFVMLSSPVDGSPPFIYVRDVAGWPLAFYVHPLVRLPQFGLGMLVAHGLQALKSDADLPSGGKALVREYSSSRDYIPVDTTPEGLPARKPCAGTPSAPCACVKHCSSREGAVLPSNCELLLARVSDVAAFLILAAPIVSQAIQLYAYPANSVAQVANRMNLASPLFALFLFSTAGSGSAASISKFLLTLRPVLVIGEWSYGFYLWHPMVAVHLGCWTLHSEPKCQTQTFATAYVYSALLSCLSFYVVEEPARKMLKFDAGRR